MKGKNKQTSTSNSRYKITSKKKWIEMEPRNLLTEEKPHSNVDFFSKEGYPLKTLLVIPRIRTITDSKSIFFTELF